MNDDKLEAVKERRHEPMLAVLILMGAVVIAPIVDSLAKWMSADIPVLQITWARFVGHSLCLMPFVLWRYGVKAYTKPPQAKLQVLRGLALLMSSTCFFIAISTIPLADALAVTFVESFFVLIFAVLFLGEKVGWRRILAVIAGFIGVLIVLRPGTANLQMGHLWALAAGFGYGSYFFLSRFLSDRSPSLITMAHTAVVGAIVLTIVVPFVWVPVTSNLQILGLLAIGLITAVAHISFQMAFERGEASFIAAFAYSEIITMTFFGWLFFGDFPDHYTWLGVAILVAAGVFVAWRESLVQKQKALGGKVEA